MKTSFMTDTIVSENEGGFFMNRHAVQLIARGAINRMGNMFYDYGEQCLGCLDGDGGKDGIRDLSNF